MRTTRAAAIIAAIAGIALALSACSTGSEAADSGDGSSSAAAEEQLASVYEGVGSDLADLPEVTPRDGVNLYVVSCGEQIPSCASTAQSMKDAGEAAGWTVTVADGKLNPDGFATAIRQAIAGGADVIIPVGIGCGVAQAAFQEAVDVGITIVGGGGADDCDPKLWASERLWLPDVDLEAAYKLWGAQQADYAWGRHNGAAKVILLNFTTQVWGQWITDGFTSRLEELGGSEIVETLDIADPETADGSYVQKITTAALSHPEANTLVMPIDGWISNGLGAAIVSAGLDDQLLVVSRSGDASVLDMIRQGGSGIDATLGFPNDWGAWGSVDTAIRVLAGTEPVYIGESSQMIDQDHNLPDSGSYDGSTDYKARFLAAWGVS